MQRIEFTLTGPMRLVPVSGTTNVKVSSTGRVKIIDFTPSENPRIRKIHLCATSNSKMWLSPNGVRRTVQINLPASATQEDFEVELDRIFEAYDLKYMLDNA